VVTGLSLASWHDVSALTYRIEFEYVGRRRTGERLDNSVGGVSVTLQYSVWDASEEREVVSGV